MSISYRMRLKPFIDQWLARGTRVAIFGIGAHTDRLFKAVPDLAKVRIVGYLDSHQSIWGRKYRGKKVFPTAWADRNADVILCSSFVSEPNMAAAVEHLRCKVIMSHTPPNFSSPSSPQQNENTNAPQFVFRPSPVGRVIPWPTPNDDGISEGRRERLGSYLRNTAVLDAILEQFFPFVANDEAEVARAIVRYVNSGARIIQICGQSARIGALLSLCAGHCGEMISIAPQYSKSAIRGLIKRYKPLVDPQSRTRRAKPGALSFLIPAVTGQAGDAGLDQASILRTAEGVFRGHGRGRKPLTGPFPHVLYIDDESLAAAFLQSKTRILRHHRPIVFCVLEFMPAFGGAGLAFKCFEELGYGWILLGAASPPASSGLPMLVPAEGLATVLAVPDSDPGRSDCQVM